MNVDTNLNKENVLTNIALSTALLNFISSKFIIFDRSVLKEESFNYLGNVMPKKLSFNGILSNISINNRLYSCNFILKKLEIGRYLENIYDKTQILKIESGGKLARIVPVSPSV